VIFIKKYFCDKCGKEIINYKFNKHYFILETSHTVEKLFKNSTVEKTNIFNFMLCDKCKKEFVTKFKKEINDWVKK